MGLRSHLLTLVHLANQRSFTTIFFGFAIGFIGCYKGFNSNKGTESVGIAANSAVVNASLWIFFLDVVAVQLSQILFY